MTRQELIDRLTVEFTKAMRPVLERITEEDEDGAAELIGWLGHDIDRLMAKAAVSVLEATIDVQEYMKREGVVNAE